MANTTEILRLMRHTADLLDACDPTTNADIVAQLSSLPSAKYEANDRATAETVAISTASMVLRMVAAALDDEPSETQPIEHGGDRGQG